MSTAVKSRVAALADATDLDGAEGYFTQMVRPVTAESAVVIAAIAAGAAIAASAGYIANAWANLGHPHYHGNNVSTSDVDGAHGSVDELVGFRVATFS